MASPEDVARAILAAGFPGDDAIVMLSIGQAESGLYELATKDDAVERSLGWPQINTRVHNVTDACCYDVQCAANYAFLLYSGRGQRFTDWSTYNNGAYAAYMPSSRATFAGLGSSVGQGNGTSDEGSQPTPPSNGQSLLVSAAVLAGFWWVADTILEIL